MNHSISFVASALAVLFHRFLLASVCAAMFLHCGSREKRALTEAERILARATSYLWANQGTDGGWHSTMHGVMRTGQTLTPYMLHALTEVPADVFQIDSTHSYKAIKFLRAHINDRGVLGLADADIIEYPNYSTAYALRVFVKLGDPADSTRIRAMTAYLAGEQFTEQRGILPGHPAYGSWGFGETNLSKGRVGHVDLSHTRHVLEALREAGWNDTTAMEKTTRFLRLLQKHPTHNQSPAKAYDGGFYFSPIVLDQNKAGKDDHAYRSYATATCGGIMALVASGENRESEPVQAAMRWLAENPTLDYPAGIPEDDPDHWRKVLFFYHLSVRAEVYHALGKQGGWKDEIVRLLLERQDEDGSFANPYGSPNKEDDPLLATTLVVRTLTNLISSNP
ncbi:MAG: prenyltransferase/squalene oxidase repeat-containing protein [Bacteroidota bacterium]